MRGTGRPRPGCSTTRQDKSAIPALAQLTEQSASPLGRLHALYALDGLDALAEAYVLRALDDPDPGVREHGVRLSERIIAARGLSDTLWRQLKARVDDADAARAVSAGLHARRDQASRSARCPARADQEGLEQPWMHAAVLSSLADGAGEVFSV